MKKIKLTVLFFISSFWIISVSGQATMPKGKFNTLVENREINIIYLVGFDSPDDLLGLLGKDMNAEFKADLLKPFIVPKTSTIFDFIDAFPKMNKNLADLKNANIWYRVDKSMNKIETTEDNIFVMDIRHNFTKMESAFIKSGVLINHDHQVDNLILIDFINYDLDLNVFGYSAITKAKSECRIIGLNTRTQTVLYDNTIQLLSQVNNYSGSGLVFADTKVLDKLFEDLFIIISEL